MKVPQSRREIVTMKNRNDNKRQKTKSNYNVGTGTGEASGKVESTVNRLMDDLVTDPSISSFVKPDPSNKPTQENENSATKETVCHLGPTWASMAQSSIRNKTSQGPRECTYRQYSDTTKNNTKDYYQTTEMRRRPTSDLTLNAEFSPVASDTDLAKDLENPTATSNEHLRREVKSQNSAHDTYHQGRNPVAFSKGYHSSDQILDCRRISDSSSMHKVDLSTEQWCQFPEEWIGKLSAETACAAVSAQVSDRTLYTEDDMCGAINCHQIEATHGQSSDKIRITNAQSGTVCATEAFVSEQGSFQLVHPKESDTALEANRPSMCISYNVTSGTQNVDCGMDLATYVENGADSSTQEQTEYGFTHNADAAPVMEDSFAAMCESPNCVTATFSYPNSAMFPQYINVSTAESTHTNEQYVFPAQHLNGDVNSFNSIQAMYRPITSDPAEVFYPHYLTATQNVDANRYECPQMSNPTMYPQAQDHRLTHVVSDKMTFQVTTAARSRIFNASLLWEEPDAAKYTEALCLPVETQQEVVITQTDVVKEAIALQSESPVTETDNAVNVLETQLFPPSETIENKTVTDDLHPFELNVGPVSTLDPMCLNVKCTDACSPVTFNISDEDFATSETIKPGTQDNLFQESFIVSSEDLTASVNLEKTYFTASEKSSASSMNTRDSDISLTAIENLCMSPKESAVSNKDSVASFKSIPCSESSDEGGSQ